jgi:hypothetical protein
MKSRFVFWEEEPAIVNVNYIQYMYLRDNPFHCCVNKPQASGVTCAVIRCRERWWSRSRFFEVLIAQLVKKFPAIRGTLWFRTSFTRILHWKMSSIPALAQYFFNIHFNIILTQPRRFSKFFTSGLYAKSYVYTRSQSVSHGNYFFWPQYGNRVIECIRSKERGVYLKMLPSDGIC